MRLSKQQYLDAIEALKDGMTQLEPDGKCCAVCGDSDHQAWECHHNPLVTFEEYRVDRTRWRCYHCDAVFTDHQAAAEHFGCKMSGAPICANVKVKILSLLEGLQADIDIYVEGSDFSSEESDVKLDEIKKLLES